MVAAIYSWGLDTVLFPAILVPWLPATMAFLFWFSGRLTLKAENPFRKRARLIVAHLGLLIAAYALFFHSFNNGIESFMRGFRDQAISRIDAAKLQEWAVATIRSRPHNEERRWSLDFGESPTQVRDLWRNGTPMVVVDPKTCLYIAYGSGFGHWGLLVGDSSFTPSSLDDRTQYLLWQSGIYVFYGD